MNSEISNVLKQNNNIRSTLNNFGKGWKNQETSMVQVISRFHRDNHPKTAVE